MADTATVYCTKDEVQRWVKRVQFGSDTKVTLADIDSYIQSISAVVDGELRALGFALPIPSTAKVTMSILKLLVSYEVASQAEQAANFGTNKNESKHGAWLHQQYLDLLGSIKGNPAMLSDIARSSVGYIRTDADDKQEAITAEHVRDFIAESQKSASSNSRIPGEPV